jgi:hypothetical protein
MKLRATLFWDVDPKTIQPKRHARYIAERVMNFGNDREARWLIKNYSRKFLKTVVSRSQSIDKQTKALWTLLLNRR